MTTRTIYVKPTHLRLWARVDRTAKRLGLSRSTVVVLALEDWLATQRVTRNKR